ncbi:MAG: hypothetical protein HUN04_06420 [Desulfobacter sp.]|nr:MAG: hypothetical protein HUN04_06420 [Desulfobacter sp.]
MAILLALAGATGCRSAALLPRAEKGQLDLQKWDFEAEGPVRLDGDWAFYWGKFMGPERVAPDTPAAARAYYPVPGLWKHTPGGPGGKTGFATYGLRVTGLDGKGVGGLFINDILSAGQVFVNGRLLVSRGMPGADKKSEQPVEHALALCFPPPDNGVLDILIQVSNFHNSQGGINTPVWLGTESGIRRMADRQWITAGVLGAGLMIIGIYHILIYLVRRQEQISMIFGAYALLLAVQTLFGVNGGCLMAYLFPGLPWRLSIDMTLLPFGLAAPLLVMFFHRMFPEPYAPVINKCYGGLGGVFVLYLLATPGTKAYDPVVLGFMPVTLSAMLYVFARLVKRWMQGEKTARFLFPGYLILALTAVNDVLSDLHILDTTRLVPLGILIFILFHSFVITLRFSTAFAAVDALTLKLRRREKRELELRLMQRRLSSMLDRVDDALIGVNGAGEIGVVNRAFETFTGQSADRILGTAALSSFKEIPCLAPLVPCLSSPASSLSGIEIHLPDRAPVSVDVVISPLDLEEEAFRLMVLKPAGGMNGGEGDLPSASFIERLNLNRERMMKFEALLDHLAVPGRGEGTLKSIDRLLNRLPSPGPSATADKRSLAVHIMNRSIEYWSVSTGTSKAEMAEKSGLWNVYIEKDGWVRTQTLDKYLSLESLPARPRWKSILNTAEYVLAACSAPTPLRERLAADVEAFRALK